MTRYYENEEGIICEVPEDVYISCRKQKGVLKLKTTNGMVIKEDIVSRRLTKNEFGSLNKDNITTKLSRFNIYKAK